MKLPDFRTHAELLQLLDRMGAKYREDIVPSAGWQVLDPALLAQLQTVGLDVDAGEVETVNGLLTWRGRQVAVYIRDQSAGIRQNGGEYKFHVAPCSTLQKMHLNKRYGRYVVCTRTDGHFVVNVLAPDRVERHRKLERMRVCRNCLSALAWKGYPGDGERIYREFDLSTFYSECGSRIAVLPRHTDESAPLNVYPPEFAALSRAIRAACAWRCDECSADFSRRQRDLHVHHINGDKTDNRAANLQVLCRDCHGRQFGHAPMDAKG